MPLVNKDPCTFSYWRAGEKFDRVSERLLVTTNRGDSFVVCRNPGNDDDPSLVIDLQFMPENLATIPQQLREESVFLFPLFDWDPSIYPWRIFVSDGYGPFVDLEAAGAGWKLSIKPSFTVQSIERVQLADIDSGRWSHVLSGLYFTFTELEIDNEALHREFIRQFHQGLKSI
ncbi:MAG: hypothetical protein ACOH18_02935 [Candidatus Saccharimonadaceae bacterium]